MLKNLSILKTNFGSADGLGIGYKTVCLICFNLANFKRLFTISTHLINHNQKHEFNTEMPLLI
jgi:hypothetical protein